MESIPKNPVANDNVPSIGRERWIAYCEQVRRTAEELAEVARKALEEGGADIHSQVELLVEMNALKLEIERDLNDPRLGTSRP